MSTSEDVQGEGNREADRRYREGVRETVESTDSSEMAEQARNLTDEEIRRIREAEKKARTMVDQDAMTVVRVRRES